MKAYTIHLDYRFTIELQAETADDAEAKARAVAELGLAPDRWAWQESWTEREVTADEVVEVDLSLPFDDETRH